MHNSEALINDSTTIIIFMLFKVKVTYILKNFEGGREGTAPPP